MIELNGYSYTYDEVIEALEKKGYKITCLEISDDPRDFPLYKWFAFKGNEPCIATDRIESVAIKEFHKKPPLV